MNDKDYFRKGGEYVVEMGAECFDNEPHILKNKNLVAVLFYADWCKFCKAVAPTWKELSKKVSGECKICAFNCANPNNLAHFEKIKRSKPGLVPSFPTIVFYKNGEPVETLPESKRNLKDMMATVMRLVKH